MFEEIQRAVKSLAGKDVFGYLLFACTTLILAGLMIQPGEGLVYPLDDTYIHVALSGNLAQHGVWGVSANHAAFCSSSPLWTLLLAGVYKITGVNSLTPFLLATLFGFSSMRVFCGCLRRQSVQPGWRTLAACLFCGLVPLPVLAVLGMEHSMHVFFMLAFVDRLLLCLSASEKGKFDVPLLVYAFAAVATRYESLFLIAPAAVLLLIHGKLVMGFVLMVVGPAPIGLYGTWAMASGGFFFPNSIVFKGQFMSAFQAVCRGVLMHLRMTPNNCHVYVLVIVALISACRNSLSKVTCGVLIVSALATVGHFTFADVGSIGRYEAYIIASVLMLVAPIFCRLKLNSWGMRETAQCALVLFLMIPLLFRMGKVMCFAVHGSRDIFCQQLQMVRLFQTLPVKDRGVVAVNDIGCMSCAADIESLDIWGLGDQEIARLRKSGDVNYLREIQRIMRERRVKYAALFDGWFPRDTVPSNMILVGRLVNPENLICAESAVMLYAADESHAEALRHAMSALAESLPSGVIVEHAQ